jgi:hypothetical protein
MLRHPGGDAGSAVVLILASDRLLYKKSSAQREISGRGNMVSGSFSLSAALLLAVCSLVCIFWTNPLLHKHSRPVELASSRRTSVTAATFSKTSAIRALPPRIQELKHRLKPVRFAMVSKEPELSSVARMTALQSEGDLSPTTQNEIDIIENNMNFLRDEMSKVSEQLTSEHDFMQVNAVVAAI